MHLKMDQGKISRESVEYKSLYVFFVALQFLKVIDVLLNVPDGLLHDQTVLIAGVVSLDPLGNQVSRNENSFGVLLHLLL
jgi:hypothetical protein